MVREVLYGDDYILIESREGMYYPYIDWISLQIGAVARTIVHIYSQDDLKQAYETGMLRSAFR